MRVVDLFAGLRGWSEPFADRGHEVFSIDIDPRFEVSLHADVRRIEPADFPWRPDVVLASPPCETFSTMTFGHHWNPGRIPKTEAAEVGIALVERTVALIRAVAPRFYVVENPVGMLRKLPVLGDLQRRTVTYCAYGARYRKPTDLWGRFPPSLVLRPKCRNGDPCHVRAPRGSRTGVQGDLAALDGRSEGRRDLAAERAKVPYALGLDFAIAAERDLDSLDEGEDPRIWEVV